MFVFALLRARPPSYPAAAGLRDRTPAPPPPAYAVAPSVSSEATTARGERYCDGTARGHAAGEGVRARRQSVLGPKHGSGEPGIGPEAARHNDPTGAFVATRRLI